MVETVEQALRVFDRGGSRVVRATLHEDGGDRQVWFVKDHGWCFLVSDEKLIAFARAHGHEQVPLVAEPGDRTGVSWPERGSEV